LGNNILDGGAGVNTVSFSFYNKAMFISLKKQIAYELYHNQNNINTIYNFSKVVGTNYSGISKYL
jgi:hypothetical protein